MAKALVDGVLVDLSAADSDAFRASVRPPLPPTIDDYSRAIQAHLDETAKLRRYDSIHTAVGYRDDPNPVFAAEAQALFVWRSAVWTYVTVELAKVEGGMRPQPSVAEIVAELPAMVWPASSRLLPTEPIRPPRAGFSIGPWVSSRLTTNVSDGPEGEVGSLISRVFPVEEAGP